MLPFLVLPVRDRVPIELEVPVEPPHIDAPGIPEVVLESVIAYHIDDRADNVCGVLVDTVQHRFQPSCGNIGLG